MLSKTALWDLWIYLIAAYDIHNGSRPGSATALSCLARQANGQMKNASGIGLVRYLRTTTTVWRKPVRQIGKKTCNTRKLAESLYDVDDFAGSHYAWAQIADQYISGYQRTSLWASDINVLGYREHALDTIAKASIGCILNAYLA